MTTTNEHAKEAYRLQLLANEPLMDQLDLLLSEMPPEDSPAVNFASVAFLLSLNSRILELTHEAVRVIGSMRRREQDASANP